MDTSINTQIEAIRQKSVVSLLVLIFPNSFLHNDSHNINNDEWQFGKNAQKHKLHLRPCHFYDSFFHIFHKCQSIVQLIFLFCSLLFSNQLKCGCIFWCKWFATLRSSGQFCVLESQIRAEKTFFSLLWMTNGNVSCFQRQGFICLANKVEKVRKDVLAATLSFR